MATKEYVTSDVGLAAFLVTVGHKLTKAPFLDGARVRFSFPQSPQLESDLADFFTGQSKVDGLALTEQNRKLRILVTEIRRSTRSEVYSNGK